MTVGTALRFVGCQHSVKVNNGGEIEPRAIAETLKARRWRLMTDVRPVGRALSRRGAAAIEDP
jgi:hypothetical protein